MILTAIGERIHHKFAAQKFVPQHPVWLAEVKALRADGRAAPVPVTFPDDDGDPKAVDPNGGVLLRPGPLCVDQEVWPLVRAAIVEALGINLRCLKVVVKLATREKHARGPNDDVSFYGVLVWVEIRIVDAYLRPKGRGVGVEALGENVLLPARPLAAPRDDEVPRLVHAHRRQKLITGRRRINANLRSWDSGGHKQRRPDSEQERRNKRSKE